MTLKKNDHLVVTKSWGYEKIYYNKKYCYKELVFNAKSNTSMHRHIVKKETFVTKQEGFLLEYVDSKINLSYIIALEPDTSYTLEPCTWHRIYNNTNNILTLTEISTHHEDLDVERSEN